MTVKGGRRPEEQQILRRTDVRLWMTSGWDERGSEFVGFRAALSLALRRRVETRRCGPAELGGGKERLLVIPTAGEYREERVSGCDWGHGER